MLIWRDTTALPDAHRGAACAIGNFDGVHLGHQAVISAAQAEARARSAPSAVLTFEPHPRSFFRPDAPPFRLMNATARQHRLERLGVDHLYECPFNADLAALSPEGFAREILVGRYGIRHAVVGADFFFGKDRAGTAETLGELGAELGFGVTVLPLVGTEAGEVSSTAIRAALSEGRPEEAARMLGHWHRIEGIVEHGEKRGRELGFPTANISIAGLHPPRFGVYAVLVDVLTGPHAGSYHGACSIGTRPQFGGEVPNCETYLFDFSGDLYGETLSVALVAFLRPEQTFDGLDALVAQMQADCARAREILAHA